MNTEKPGGADAARAFLKEAIRAKQMRDELESFGEEDLITVVKIAERLGYHFTADELRTVLDGEWDPESRIYVNRFCLSEPPGF